MSRTIRRPQAHLIRWWLPDNHTALTRTRHPKLHKRLQCRQDSVIVREVQSDIHRFFCGPSKFSRNTWERQIRSSTKHQVHQYLRLEDYEILHPIVHRPYM